MRGPKNGLHKTWFELKTFRNLPLGWSNLCLLFPLPFVFLVPEPDMSVALMFVDKYVSESYIWRMDKFHNIIMQVVYLGIVIT